VVIDPGQKPFMVVLGQCRSVQLLHLLLHPEACGVRVDCTLTTQSTPVPPGGASHPETPSPLAGLRPEPPEHQEA
jgi:hypothetical protein